MAAEIDHHRVGEGRTLLEPLELLQGALTRGLGVRQHGHIVWLEPPMRHQGRLHELLDIVDTARQRRDSSQAVLVDADQQRQLAACRRAVCLTEPIHVGADPGGIQALGLPALPCPERLGGQGVVSTFGVSKSEIELGFGGRGFSCVFHQLCQLLDGFVCWPAASDAFPTPSVAAGSGILLRLATSRAAV